jgi:hypothetical protein
MFGRKKSEETTEDQVSPADAPSEESLDADLASGPRGPWDSSEIPADGRGRVDLGSLHLAPQPGVELRIQVNDNTGEVQSVLLAAPDGGLELRAFAAPRHGDLWSEVRPQLVADIQRRGGSVQEQEGTFGPELVCRLSAPDPDGRQVQQDSRIVGVNGDRWFLRATFLGAPARGATEEWDALLSDVVVHRGEGAMPPGDALPVSLPEEIRNQNPSA